MNDSPDESRNTFWQFSLRDLLVLFFVISMLFAVLALVPLDQGRTNARRNACVNNLKQLAVGLHMHHDHHRRFPTTSSESIEGLPGSYQGEHPAGYSWIVSILPYIEEQPLHDQWRKLSNDFKLPPFDPRNSAGGMPLSTVRNQALVCPTFAGSDEVDAAHGDYATYGPAKDRRTPGLTNYVAFAGSHFTTVQGLGRLPSSEFEGDGIFPFPIRTPAKLTEGARVQDVTDGSSKTLMLTESCESAYAAWCDGQATWVIGAWPSTTNVPQHYGAKDNVVDFGWPDDVLAANRISLGIGSDQPDGEVYLPDDRWSGTRDRRWGPSSDHSRGEIVNHAFVDGHVRGLSVTIDKNLYLRLINRHDGSKVELPDE